MEFLNVLSMLVTPWQEKRHRRASLWRLRTSRSRYNDANRDEDSSGSLLDRDFHVNATR